MKLGSIGEIPPRTRVKLEFSLRTATDAVFTKSAYTRQPASSSKSQCDMLFGSFHSLTASIMPWLRPIPRGGRSGAEWPHGTRTRFRHPHRLRPLVLQPRNHPVIGTR